MNMVYNDNDNDNENDNVNVNVNVLIGLCLVGLIFSGSLTYLTWDFYLEPHRRRKEQLLAQTATLTTIVE
jgi:hypothetical protein